MINKMKARLLTELYRRNKRLFLDDIKVVCDSSLNELEGRLFYFGIPFNNLSGTPKKIYSYKSKKFVSNLKAVLEESKYKKDDTVVDVKELVSYMNLLRTLGNFYMGYKDFKIAYLRKFLLNRCDYYINNFESNYDKIKRIKLINTCDLSYFSVNLLSNVSVLYGLNVILSSILEEYEIDDFMYWLVLLGDKINIKILNRSGIPFDCFVKESLKFIK